MPVSERVSLRFSCDTSFKRYADDVDTKLVAEQEFGITAGAISAILLGKPVDQLTQTRVQMLKDTVGHKFKGLKRVDFDVSSDLLTAALIDTVSCIVYSGKTMSN
ncbi:uncharacterized protein ALTATR162_LOCUS3260 [Alternaria atra]|jgi:hypothetical protein|uniref:Uncharacterized protein n=1 Tax=Alternaria atra TaxID=119953 RepID=A0A8J2HZ23_9PLEO|nr:uncharacterized protein ALTATR162_LOCUS3260 [Alternaria atra]CAG5153630.1 unnamed protein product [Alternaria atra]